jgi:hypothetical protein
VLAGELLRVGVGRDADVGHVEEPGAAGRGRALLDAVKGAAAEDGALGEVADVAGRRVRIAGAEQPDGRRADDERDRRERRKADADADEERNGGTAIATRVQGHAGLHTPARLADGLELGVALSAAAVAGSCGIRPVARGFAGGSPVTPFGRLRRTFDHTPAFRAGQLAAVSRRWRGAAPASSRRAHAGRRGRARLGPSGTSSVPLPGCGARCSLAAP